MNLFLNTWIFIWSLLLCVSEISCDTSEELRLECEQGELEGMFLTTKGGREIRAFMSIPYAKPPVGKLRFKAPVPQKKWSGVLNATVVHDVCIQRNLYLKSTIIEGVEDCLYLNVYTPKKADIKAPLPVMMFLHGGGYYCGGGNFYWYGPGRLLDRDVVLVVPNYRLGPLGFLSTGDDIFPGNNGLKDQNSALKWIRKNIAPFGGDPSKITVFGQSAGGAATHLHMMSPISRGMIKRGISHSGTGLAPWTIAPPGEAKEQAHKLAKLLKCPTTPSQTMLLCLQKIKAYRFIELDKKYMEWDYDPMIPFKPVVEHDHPRAFLKKRPEDIIKSGKMSKIPWMVGVTASDGAIRAAGLLPEQHRVDQQNDDFERIIPISLLYEKNVQDVVGVTKAIKELYFGGNSKIGRETQQNFVDMYTDGWFFNNTDFSIKLQRQFVKNNIYLYKFAYRGSASFTELFGDPFNDYGACHTDELQYLFPMEAFFPGKFFSDLDKKMSEHITDLWINFASNGVPSRDDDGSISEWTTVQSDRLEYYHLEVPEKSYMGTDMFSERVKVWRTLDNNEYFINKDEL